MGKKEFTKTSKSSFCSFFMRCKSGGRPEVDSPDDAVSVASDDSILAGFVSKPETTSPTIIKAIVEESEARRAPFCSLFMHPLLCCVKFSRQKVDSRYAAVSVASNDSVPSYSYNERHISVARTACRNEAPDAALVAETSILKRRTSNASTVSLGRHDSDCSSDDGYIGGRARGSTITTFACVHRVNDGVNDQEIVV